MKEANTPLQACLAIFPVVLFKIFTATGGEQSGFFNERPGLFILHLMQKRSPVPDDSTETAPEAACRVALT